jgi:uncharacterized protein YjbI with pentapeptide repeats
MTPYNLNNVNLSWADLAGSVFEGMTLDHTKLTRANLSWTNMRKVTFKDVDLSGADMSSAKLENAVLAGRTTFGRRNAHANVAETQLIPHNPIRLKGPVTWDMLRQHTTQIVGSTFSGCVQRSSAAGFASIHEWPPAEEPYPTVCGVRDPTGDWAYGAFMLYASQ